MSDTASDSEESPANRRATSCHSQCHTI